MPAGYGAVDLEESLTVGLEGGKVLQNRASSSTQEGLETRKHSSIPAQGELKKLQWASCATNPAAAFSGPF